jgi:hypothetical protein
MARSHSCYYSQQRTAQGQLSRSAFPPPPVAHSMKPRGCPQVSLEGRTPLSDGSAVPSISRAGYQIRVRRTHGHTPGCSSRPLIDLVAQRDVPLLRLRWCDSGKPHRHSSSPSGQVATRARRPCTPCFGGIGLRHRPSWWKAGVRRAKSLICLVCSRKNQ